MNEAELSAALRAAVHELAPAIRPVSIVQQGSGRKRFEGTCINIADEEHRFIETAEHVVSGPEEKLVGITKDGSISWPQHYRRLESIADPNMDLDGAFALARVDAEALSANMSETPITLVH